ncbi:MAG: hypothetical protein QOJ25_1976 [Solirubrobacteraceae bacterium]|nr:hypothetical protein [Solirubrobacteraceae bacterium]
MPLLVILLSVAGYVVTTRAADDERGNAAHRRAETQALAVQGQLEQTHAFAVGLGNALAEERAPGARRFAALVGSAATTVGLTDAMWVERITGPGRRNYERRIGLPITTPPGTQVATPAATYLPATFVTGVGLRPGADMSGLPALASTLRDPTSVFAGTATPVASLARQRGFFLVEGGQYGHGPGSQGFLVVFVPADWLSVSLNLDPHRTAVSLDGRPLAGPLAGPPAASQGFEALTRRWRVVVAREPPSALQATLPWLAVAWPPATALLIYLLGRGMLRRRRAERQVDDIFDLSLDLLCVASLDGYLKRVNPAFERTLGYEAAELLSRPFLEYVHPDDRERTAETLRALRAGRQVSDFENRYVRADGAVRWLQWNIRTMPDRGLTYGAARDVTDNRMLSREQAALRRVATLVAEGQVARELFDAVALEVGQLLSADATRLLRYQDEGTACLVGSYGDSDPGIGVGSDLRVDQGQLWGRVAVPIIVSGRPWGAIVAAWKDPEMAGGDTEIRMAQFTELVATAVANAESAAELAASRRRIVTAADEARRRIERDLHDGAQQRLVHSMIVLKLALGALKTGDEQVGDLVAEALQNAEQAHSELRELAHGILPAGLTRGGLRTATKALQSRLSLPLRVDVSKERLPAEIEATAYFVISESLTNVAKHAHADQATVIAQVEDRHLRVEISDNGIGGANAAGGSGLIGLSDRVAALGGVLAVHSEPGAGTVVTVQIPVTAPTPARADG